MAVVVDIFSMSCHTGIHLDGFGRFVKDLRSDRARRLLRWVRQCRRRV